MLHNHLRNFTSHELLINFLCGFFLFLAFRFEICHFFRKAFCILTGYDRSLFNWSSHSIYMINITLQRYHFSFIIKN